MTGSHRPVWDFEEGKDLGGNLDQNPGDHDISDRDAINLSPFQFDKELLQRCAPGRRVLVDRLQGHSMVMAREVQTGKKAHSKPQGFHAQTLDARKRVPPEGHASACPLLGYPRFINRKSASDCQQFREIVAR